MKIYILLTLLLSVVANAEQKVQFRNMLIPLAKCVPTADSVAKAEVTKNSAPQEVTLLVDFEALLSKAPGKALLVFLSSKRVVSSALTGEFAVDTQVGTVTFTSDQVLYNHAHQSIVKLTLNADLEKIVSSPVQGEMTTTNLAKSYEDTSERETYICAPILKDL